MSVMGTLPVFLEEEQSLVLAILSNWDTLSSGFSDKAEWLELSLLF